MDGDKLTINAGLAEIKTLVKRIAEKRQFVVAYLVRPSVFHDALEGQGGSAKCIVETEQGVRDLEERFMAIRRAIQYANATTQVTVCGVTRTIADWLTWRRELAVGRRAHISKVMSTIATTRSQLQKDGPRIERPGQEAEVVQAIVNVDEKALAVESEQIETILGTLDGVLSNINATVTLDL
jgi:hypothetical protein